LPRKPKTRVNSSRVQSGIGGSINYPRASRLKLIDERRLAFKDKTADEILAMQRANFEVEYQNIVAVGIRKGLLTSSLEFVIEGHPDTKMSFWIERNQITEAKEVLRKFLPNKLSA